jgi:hypothetical protein
MPFCTSSNYGNRIFGSVNVKQQKRIIDVDPLKVLKAALLLFVCVRMCVQMKSHRKAISFSKKKNINNLPLVGTILSIEDSLFLVFYRI